MKVIVISVFLYISTILIVSSFPGAQSVYNINSEVPVKLGFLLQILKHISSYIQRVQNFQIIFSILELVVLNL